MIAFPLLELLCAFGVIFGAISAGARVLRWIGCRPEDPVERFAWSAGIGFAVVSFAILSLGLAGFLYRPVLTGVAILLLAGAVFHGRAAWRYCREVASWFRALSLFCRVLTTLLFLFLALNLVHPLSPPLHTGTHYYHLSSPKLFLAGHRIVFLDIIYTNGPFSMQMLNLFTLGIANDTVSALVQYGVLALGVVAVFALGRRIGGDRAGLIAAAILLGFRPLKNLMGTSGDMFGIALYGTLAVSAYVIWATRGREGKWLVLAAVATGLACGVKYLGLGIGLLLTIAVTIECMRGARWKSLGIFCLVAGVIALPWFLKAWIMAGNPVWPFGYSIFGGRNWDPEAAQRLNDYLLSYGGVRHDGWDLLALPFVAFLGGTSLLLWLFPAAIMMGKPCPATRRLVLWFLGGAALWWFGSHQLRFLLPVHGALFVATAVFLDRVLARIRGKWGVVAGAALLLLVPVDLCLKIVPEWREKAEYLWTGADRERFLTDNFVSYRTIRWANENLPDDAVVYVHYYTLQYFFDRPFLPGDYLSQGRFKWWTYRTAGEAHRVLREAGATHFFIADNIAKKLNTNPEVTRGFRERYCDLLHHRNGSWLYRIRETPREENPTNLLAGARVHATSTWDHPKVSAAAVTDDSSILSSEYTGKWGWGSAGHPSEYAPEILVVEPEEPLRISEIRLFAYSWHLRTLTDFELEIFDGEWRTILRRKANREETEWFVRFKPALVEKIRLTIRGTAWDRAFVAEIQAYK